MTKAYCYGFMLLVFCKVFSASPTETQHGQFTAQHNSDSRILGRAEQSSPGTSTGRIFDDLLFDDGGAGVLVVGAIALAGLLFLPGLLIFGLVIVSSLSRGLQSTSDNPFANIQSQAGSVSGLSAASIFNGLPIATVSADGGIDTNALPGLQNVDGVIPQFVIPADEINGALETSQVVGTIADSNFQDLNETASPTIIETVETSADNTSSTTSESSKSEDNDGTVGSKNELLDIESTTTTPEPITASAYDWIKQLGWTASGGKIPTMFKIKKGSSKPATSSDSIVNQAIAHVPTYFLSPASKHSEADRPVQYTPIYVNQNGPLKMLLRK